MSLSKPVLPSLTWPDPLALSQHHLFDINNPRHRRALGAFDEEACRFFLSEVGRVIVPRLPFSFGMEEVYARILDTYGVKGISDAISVLEELLEDETSAGGFGDDGDVFRPWRHGWRHRNIDALNPFIPKVGNYVLQPATRREVRQAKKENFLELHAAGGLLANTNYATAESPPTTPRRTEDDRIQPISPTNVSVSDLPLTPKGPLLETPPFAVPRERSNNSLAAENREARVIEGTMFSRKGAAKRLSSLPFVPPPTADKRRVSSGSKWLNELRGMIRNASLRMRVASKEI